MSNTNEFARKVAEAEGYIGSVFLGIYFSNGHRLLIGCWNGTTDGPPKYVSGIPHSPQDLAGTEKALAEWGVVAVTDSVEWNRAIRSWEQLSSL